MYVTDMEQAFVLHFLLKLQHIRKYWDISYFFISRSSLVIQASGTDFWTNTPETTSNLFLKKENVTQMFCIRIGIVFD